jgi:hypothetical protein
LEVALDGILPEDPKQVAELAEIEPDRSFQRVARGGAVGPATIAIAD